MNKVGGPASLASLAVPFRNERPDGGVWRRQALKPPRWAARDLELVEEMADF